MKPSKRDKRKTPTTPPFWRLVVVAWGWILKVIAAVALIIGLAASFLTFRTHLDVGPQDVINPMRPFATPFILENKGELPVCSVALTTHIADMTYENGSTLNNGNVVYADDQFPFIDGGQSTSVWLRFPFTFPSPIKSGTVSIVVKYRPLLWFQYREQRFLFHMDTNAGGQLVWLKMMGREHGSH